MSSLLIKQIADRLNLPPDEVEVAVREWSNALRNRVSQEGQATLPGFGVFHQQGRHLTFEPEKTLSEAVNYRFAGLQTVAIEASPAHVPEAAEVATDTNEVPDAAEAVVPPLPAAASPPPERQPPPPVQRPTEDAPLSTERRTPRMREPETTELDNDRAIAQERGGFPGELTAEEDTRHAGENTPLAASPPAEHAGDATEPSQQAFAEEASELGLETQAAEPDPTAAPGGKGTAPSEGAAPDLRHKDRPLPREERPVPALEPRVPIGAADRPPVPPEERTSPWPRILIAVLALVIVGGVVFYVLNRNPDEALPAQQQAERTPVQPPPSEHDDSASVALVEPDTTAASQTTPPGTSTEPSPPDAAASTGLDYTAGGYTLVIASAPQSTAAVSAAQQYAARFREQAYPVEIISSTTDDGVLRYRVAVGQFQTLEEADAARRRLADELPEGTWVMAIPPSSP